MQVSGLPGFTLTAFAKYFKNSNVHYNNKVF